MQNAEQINRFLGQISDISLGYSEINFASPDQLEEAQLGYSMDLDGNSLISGNDGDWEEGWLVIASDQIGDPIMVDLRNNSMPVLSAAHGEGSWEPFVIADSLDSFIIICSKLMELSKNRSNPTAIEENPIPEKEKIAFLSWIEENNPESDISYWEIFTDAD